MKRLIALLGVLILFSSSPAGFAAVKSGQPCKNVGSQTKVASTVFSCTRVGKKNLWRVFSTPEKASTPKPTPSPEVLEGTDVEKEVQRILLEIQVDESLPIPSLEIVTEDGPNGIYPAVTEKSARYALKFYKAAGFPIPLAGFKVFLGRTNEFMHASLAKYNCYDNMLDVQSAGFYGYCNTEKIGVIIDPILRYGPPYSTNPTSNDLGIFTPSEQGLINWQSLVPHEIFHSQQKDWSDGLGKSSFKTGITPQWFSEGTPQLLAFMSIAKMDSKQIGHVVNTYIGSKGDCRTAIEDLKPGCQYSEGVIAAQFLVAKYGGLASVRKIQEGVVTKSFADAFESATGKPLSSFYLELNGYLAIEGWIK